jgi:hypothetical protein
VFLRIIASARNRSLILAIVQDLCRFCEAVRVACGRLLRSILRRQRAAFCAASKVLFRHLQVVLGRYLWCVADPLRNDVQREVFTNLGFARSTKILEQPGPRLDACTFQNPSKLCAEVGVRVAIADDDVDLCV